MAEPEPLILCMENSSGEEVSLNIEPEDTFHVFLEKAKILLGYDVDISSITGNQPVSLDTNIYNFLLKAEQHFEGTTLNPQNLDEMIDQNDTDDLVYILNDGTQIRASQIQFDNDDPIMDLTAEELPFVKYKDDSEDENEIDNMDTDVTIRNVNIIGSPIARWSNKDNPKRSFANSLPFNLVCNSIWNFEAQFEKYLESETNLKTYTNLSNVAKNKSPISLMKDNDKDYDDVHIKNDSLFTREDVLNMFKDTPVTTLPSNENQTEKLRNVRKTHVSRSVHKNLTKPTNIIDVDTGLEKQKCFICCNTVNNNEKLYLFDKEDQMLHKCERKYNTQLKIICDRCLTENFAPTPIKSPNESLENNEYLVIKNNQQFIFQKTSNIDLKSSYFLDNINMNNSNNVSKINKVTRNKENAEFVKVEIGPDGEIVTKPVDNDVKFDDVMIVKEKKESSSDVEIVEPDVMEAEPEIDVDDLENVDEEVKEFLGKYQCDVQNTEFKCRFCQKEFKDLLEVMEHAEEHKHDLDEGIVFPCPFCDYGYSNSKWLKGHLKAAHDVKKEDATLKQNKDDAKQDNDDVIQEKDDVEQEKEKDKHEKGDEQEKDDVKKQKNEDKQDKNYIKQEKDDVKEDDTVENEHETVIQENNDEENNSPECSPVAKRTRSARKKIKDIENTGNGTHENKDPKETNSNDIVLQEQEKIKSEVKQECQDSSDGESIWIVQTGDDDEELKSLLQISEGKEDVQKNLKRHKCFACSKIFPTAVSLTTHKCRKRGKKRQFNVTKDESAVISKKEDIKKPCKRKNRELDDLQIVTCHNCNESFTSKVRLKFHMQFHEPTNLLRSDGQYACAKCEDATFPTETELFDHVHFQHIKQKRWPCSVKGCGKKFILRATLTKHSRTHTDTRRYVCVTCGKRFLDKQTLDEHGVTHLQIKPFQCHICLKQLTRRSRLRMHLRAHEEELSPALVLVCAICSRAFRDHGDAQEHATKSTECIEAFTSDIKEEAESTEQQLSPTSGIVRHSVRVVELSQVKSSIPKEMNNEECEKLLSPLDDGARNIIRVVLIEKAFRCEYCEDVFYLENALNKHRIVHKDIKNPFTCHICKVRFATYSRCTTHKTTHGFYKRNAIEGRPEESSGPANAGILGYGGFPVVKHFLCEDCGRSYLHWTYFQVHRRMKHASEKFMFKCNQCELIFPNSWSATYHRKKVHNKNGQDENGGFTKIVQDNHRIPCRDCEEVLPNKIALYKHRQREHCDETLICKQDFSDQEDPRTTICNKCGHNLHSVVALQKHTKEVHGCSSGGLRARAHTCPVCARVFRSASVRNEHVRAHTSDQPISCDVCGVTFTRATEMRNHRLTHSDVRPWACTRCAKRFRVKSDLKTHMKVKHPTELAVIEIEGTSCTPEEILRHLKNNNIGQDSVIEITMISFPKDSTNIVPNSMRALSMLSHVPRTKIDCNWDRNITTLDQSNASQPIQLDRGIEKNPRKPLILQRSNEASQSLQDTYNVPAQNVVGETLQLPLILQITDDSSQNPQDIYNIPAQIVDGEIPTILQRSTEVSQEPQDTYNITPLQNVDGEALRRPAILQRTDEASQNPQAIYNITPLQNVDGENLSTLNLQLLLPDGAVGNGNQMVDLQLDDGMLLE
ncbi:zinc finger protein 729-like isoform X2 [Maniola hyperantus]|uniref:zinc finger protein 729-like isoform X2 n=1 Tax=Aphantopus hyperantus TaxID=2795564 RepID=UPI003747C843